MMSKIQQVKKTEEVVTITNAMNIDSSGYSAYEI